MFDLQVNLIIPFLLKKQRKSMFLCVKKNNLNDKYIKHFKFINWL